MPSQNSSILGLPLIQPAQAQKHVTHNEAPRLLDVLVQLVVSSRSTSAPPLDPPNGRRHIVPAGASGAWAGYYPITGPVTATISQCAIIAVGRWY